MTENKIVGAYARVSKVDQHPENQINELIRYVNDCGWTMYNGKPFVDHGFSGSKGADKRPGFKALMAAAHSRKIDVVLVWELSRFARSTKQLVAASEDFLALKIDFISIQQHFDTTTPSGRFTFGMFALLAEFERAMIIERTKLGLLEAKANGKILGRRSNPFDMETMKSNLHLSVRQLADRLEVSPTTAARIKRKYGVPQTCPENDQIIVGEAL